MDELIEIKSLIQGLEKKIRELEEENHALKRAILSACDSLSQGNTEMSKVLVDKTIRVSPNFKPPSWTKE